jgi:predicted DNA-binding transcriptional regulator AlpA
MARMLSHEDLRERGTKYSRQHIQRPIERGLFPRPVKLGAGGTNAWPENEIDQYIEDRIAARDAEPTAA